MTFTFTPVVPAELTFPQVMNNILRFLFTFIDLLSVSTWQMLMLPKMDITITLFLDHKDVVPGSERSCQSAKDSRTKNFKIHERTNFELTRRGKRTFGTVKNS